MGYYGKQDKDKKDKDKKDREYEKALIEDAQVNLTTTMNAMNTVISNMSTGI
jgi:hypothetical protein